MLTILIATSAVRADASYVIPEELYTEDVVLQTIIDGLADARDVHSWAWGVMPRDLATGKPGGNVACENFDDSRCKDLEAIKQHLILPPCSEKILTACIDGLSVGRSGAEITPTTLKFETVGQRVPESKIAKAPYGGGTSVWKSPDLGEFVVLASLDYQTTKGEAEARVSNFEVQIIPVTYIENAGYFAPFTNQIYEGTNPNIFFGNTDPNRISTLGWDKCLIVTDGVCFQREEFVPNTRAKISLRVPNKVTGWLFGRMQEPSIDVTQIDQNNNLLVVEATSTVVPNLLATLPKKDVTSTPKILTWANSFFRPGDGFLEKQLAAPGFWGGHSPGADGFWAFDLWGDKLKSYNGTDKLFATNSRWMFGYTEITGNNNSCFNDQTKLLGLVTTNAPVYESAPPQLIDSVLNYKVAGPHFAADGKTIFRGVYNLSIRSEVARCLYKFTSAPIRAEISVTSEEGGLQEIAVETMSEKKGWLYLGAYNFHFSAPTIKVKFSQDPVVPKKEIITKAPVQPKKKTISCSRGKVIKKVSAINPKCPSGYRKV